MILDICRRFIYPTSVYHPANTKPQDYIKYWKVEKGDAGLSLTQMSGADGETMLETELPLVGHNLDKFDICGCAMT